MRGREALSRLCEALLEGDVRLVFALLPTGYGKSQLFRFNKHLVHKFPHVIHVLPLQALVSDLVCKLSAELHKLDVDVCYQMSSAVRCGEKYASSGMQDVVKSPLLSCYYTVSTIDSFLLDYFGIPVHQMFRPRWHSDVAIFFSHTCSLTILDEVHLALSVDAELRQEEQEELRRLLAKQIASICKVIESQVRHGLKVCVMTATLYPTCLQLMFKQLAGRVRDLLGRSRIIVYAPQEHMYVAKLRAVVRQVLGDDSIIEVVEPGEHDEFYTRFSTWHERVPTVLKQCSISDLEREPAKLVEEVCDLYHEIHSSSEDRRERGLRVLFVLNTAARAYRLYKRLAQQLRGQAHVLLVHGKCALGSKSSVVKVLEDIDEGILQSEKDIVLVSTQCVEAGLDVDFDILITEPAPAQALIQRTGRVCRRESRPGLVVVLDPEEGLAGAAGPYDLSAVRKTLEVLRRHAESRGEHEVLIRCNWRAPLCTDHLDYLKLLAHVDDDLSSQYGSLEEELRHETRVIEYVLETIMNILEEPKRILGKLDEELHGSFIRNCMLITLVDDKLQHLVDSQPVRRASELMDYLYTVSVDWLAENLDKVLRIDRREGDRACVYVYYLYRRGYDMWVGRQEYEVNVSRLRQSLKRTPLQLMYNVHAGITQALRRRGLEVTQLRVLGFATDKIDILEVEVPGTEQKIAIHTLKLGD